METTPGSLRADAYPHIYIDLYRQGETILLSPCPPTARPHSFKTVLLSSPTGTIDRLGNRLTFSVTANLTPNSTEPALESWIGENISHDLPASLHTKIMRSFDYLRQHVIVFQAMELAVLRSNTYVADLRVLCMYQHGRLPALKASTPKEEKIHPPNYLPVHQTNHINFPKNSKPLV